ncbi:MAG: hypothetical protein ACKVTZ_04665 [Bacteroidia bacterium]
MFNNRSFILHLFVALFLIGGFHSSFAQNDYYVILTTNKPTFAKVEEHVIAVMRDKKGKEWSYKIGNPQLIQQISERKDSISGDHTYMFDVIEAGVTYLEFSRNGGKETQKFDIVATTQDGKIVGDISHLKHFLTISNTPTTSTTKTGVSKPVATTVGLNEEIMTKSLLEPSRPLVKTEKMPQLEAETQIELSEKAAAFQKFHTQSLPLSLNRTNIVDIDNQMTLDVQNLNHSQKWIVEVSDEKVVEIIDAQNFVGEEIGGGLKDLQSWRFQAKGQGMCYIRLHAISNKSWMNKSNDIVYKVWVR